MIVITASGRLATQHLLTPLPTLDGIKLTKKQKAEIRQEMEEFDLRERNLEPEVQELSGQLHRGFEFMEFVPKCVASLPARVRDVLYYAHGVPDEVAHTSAECAQKFELSETEVQTILDGCELFIDGLWKMFI